MKLLRTIIYIYSLILAFGILLLTQQYPRSMVYGIWDIAVIFGCVFFITKSLWVFFFERGYPNQKHRR